VGAAAGATAGENAAAPHTAEVATSALSILPFPLGRPIVFLRKQKKLALLALHYLQACQLVVAM
jgi:hypothetical protein